MAHRRIWYVSHLCIGLSIVLIACAKPPQQEMDEARVAIEAAVAAGAETYASARLEKARELLADGEAKVDQRAHLNRNLRF